MKLSLTHTLRFDIGTPPRALQHLLLTALPTPQQKIERWSIEMPGFAEAAVFRDGFGNRAHLVNQMKPEAEIVVTVGGAVETIDKAGVLGRLEYDPMPAMFRRPTALTKADPELVEGISSAGGRIALLHELMDRVHLAFVPEAQTQEQEGQSQSQSQGEMLANAKSTAEAVHAFLGAARGLDIPARYVTGYLVEDEAARFHAWAEAWDEGLGWIGFDPMLNVCPSTEHVRLASGLDAMGTMPIRCVPPWAEMPVETVTVVVVD